MSSTPCPCLLTLLLKTEHSKTMMWQLWVPESLPSLQLLCVVVVGSWVFMNDSNFLQSFDQECAQASLSALLPLPLGLDFCGQLGSFMTLTLAFSSCLQESQQVTKVRGVSWSFSCHCRTTPKQPGFPRICGSAQKLSMNIFYAFLFFIPSLDPKGNHCLKTVLKNPHWPSVTSTLFIRLFVEKSLNPVKITVSPKNVTLQADSREVTETISPPERWLFWKTPNPCWLFPSVTSFLVSIIYQSKLVPFWAHRGDEVSEWIKLKYHSHPFQWHPTTLFL